MCYQLLEDSITERIKNFYSLGFDQTGDLISPEYKENVLPLDPKGKSDPLRASLAWLREMAAIDETDIQTFTTIKDVRNDVAHELHRMAFSSHNKETDYLSYFEPMVALLRNIEVWWIVNLELATDPDWADKEVDESGIVPGPVMMLQIMMDIALGDDERAAFYIRQFRARQPGKERTARKLTSRTRL